MKTRKQSKPTRRVSKQPKPQGIAEHWFQYGLCEESVTRNRAYADTMSSDENPAKLLYVIPAARYDEAVDAAHTAIANDPDFACIAHHQWLDLVTTVIAAIGIRPEEGK